MQHPCTVGVLQGYSLKSRSPYKIVALLFGSALEYFNVKSDVLSVYTISPILISKPLLEKLTSLIQYAMWRWDLLRFIQCVRLDINIGYFGIIRLT